VWPKGFGVVKVVIRRSPPLMILRGSRGGMLPRAITLALVFCAIAAACRFALLLGAEINGAANVVAASVVDRWHLWLGAALLCAAGARVSWGVAQRPTKRE
jgi:hypothetical protein